MPAHCWYIEPRNREKSQKINNRRATFIPDSRVYGKALDYRFYIQMRVQKKTKHLPIEGL